MSSKVYVKLIYTYMFEVHNFTTRVIQNHKIACFVSWRYGNLKYYRNYSIFRICTPNMLVYEMTYNLGILSIPKNANFLFKEKKKKS